MNEEENTPKKYGDKEYTTYEALQRQRRLETTMRAQRQEIHLLKTGNASEDDILAAQSRYRATSAEYTHFSKEMGLPQQRERVTVDGLGKIGANNSFNAYKSVAKSIESGIIKSLDVDDFNMMATANDILPEVSNVISETIASYEDYKSFYLYDSVYEVVDDKSLFETDLNEYGLPVLRINKNKLAGKTLSEVDEMIRNTSVNLPNNFKEAVIHEIGHGKAYHGKSIKQILNMNNFIKSKGVKNISAIAEADGAECVAEVEVLLYRNSHIPPKAKLLYNLCVQPDKVICSTKKFYGRGMIKR